MRVSKQTIFTVILLVGIIYCNDTFAATFNVSNTAQFRQAIENAAVNGENDTIILEAGTYKTTADGIGTFKFSDIEAYNLTIKAKNGLTYNDVILDGNNTHQVMSYTNTELSKLTLSGIAVINGKSGVLAGGIYSNNNVEIINCKISNNRTSKHGGGIYVSGEVPYNLTITIANSIISNNNASVPDVIGDPLDYDCGLIGEGAVFTLFLQIKLK